MKRASQRSDLPGILHATAPWRFTVRLLIVVGCASLLLTWRLVSTVGRLREEARSSQCAGKLAQIELVLYNYESTSGFLPPAAVTDADGKPLLSWRVVLLPMIEEEGLYKQIKLDEPWDSPNNRRFNMPPSNFVCPSPANWSWRWVHGLCGSRWAENSFPGRWQSEAAV